jgi:uncharacterized glyoxalase superfamily protein PhnB
MEDIYTTFRPDGFSTIGCYIFCDEPEVLIEFCKHAFYAKEIGRSLHSDGYISNCVLKIGDAPFMISQAMGQFRGMKSAIYIYTADVDMLHKNAIEHGATIIFDPADMEYGDRQSGIKDPTGNYWWISQRLIEKGYHN